MVPSISSIVLGWLPPDASRLGNKVSRKHVYYLGVIVPVYLYPSNHVPITIFPTILFFNQLLTMRSCFPIRDVLMFSLISDILHLGNVGEFFFCKHYIKDDVFQAFLCRGKGKKE